MTIIGVQKDHTCTDCALAKLRIQNFAHSTDVTTRAGEIVSLNISLVKYDSYGGAKFWLLIQDHYTDFLWSCFLTVIKWLKTTEKNYKFTVKTIKCDNEGKNKDLESHVLKDKDLKTKFEFTAPNSPQSLQPCGEKLEQC
jgi:hypothetical protein